VVDPRSLFTVEEIERASAYHRPLYLAVPVRLSIELGILAAACFSGLGEALFDPVAGLVWWAEVTVLTASLIAITTLVMLPISFWTGFLRERAWGFATQSAHGYLADRLKGLLVGLLLGCATLLTLVGLARSLPRWWPLAAAAAAAGLVLLLGFLAPLLLEPLFNRFTPLQDEQLAQVLRQLSSDAGIPIEHVLVADASRRTTKQNAYVSGLGHTKRLVLYDTLLNNSDQPELRLVLAHELGHRRARHLAKGAALATVSALAFVLLLWALLQWPALRNALAIDGPGDPRVVPFVLLLATSLQIVSAPFGAAISRRWERTADQLSLQLTADPNTFEQTHRKLARANLADLNPPQLAYLTLFSHPTPAERITAARAHNPVLSSS
jgi:STE24 endopeptidase